MNAFGELDSVYVILLDNFLLFVDIELDNKFEAFSIRGKVLYKQIFIFLRIYFYLLADGFENACYSIGCDQGTSI